MHYVESSKLIVNVVYYLSMCHSPSKPKSPLFTKIERIDSNSEMIHYVKMLTNVIKNLINVNFLLVIPIFTSYFRTIYYIFPTSP